MPRFGPFLYQRRQERSGEGRAGGRTGRAGNDGGEREKDGGERGKTGGERGKDGLPFPKWWDEKTNSLLLLSLSFSILLHDLHGTQGSPAPDAPTEI